MYRIIIGLLMLTMSITACSLSANQEDDDSNGENTQVTDIPIRIEDTTTEEVVLRATSTPAPTATPATNNQTTSNNSTVGNTNNTTTIVCTGVPIGWVNYTVIAGDTLSAIARRANTTTDALARANCLNDPSRISVGQVLAVPNTPIATNQTVGLLIVNPYQSYDGVYNLQVGGTVTFTWSGAPTDLQDIVFIYYGDNGSAITLGTDNSSSNGASVTWTVPNNISGRVVASGRVLGQANATRQPTELRIRAGQIVTDYGQVTVTPYMRIQNNMYILDLTQNITLSWAQAPRDAQRVEFSILIASAANPNTWTVIGTDNNPSDGASIVSTFTARMAGQVRAIAYYTNNVQVSTSRTITVSPDPNTEPANRVEGNIQVSGYSRMDGSTYVLTVGSTVTLTWSPPSYAGRTLGPAHYLLLYRDGSNMVIGTDEDFNDTVRITWVVTPIVIADIVASAREPGQNGTSITSNSIRLTSEVPEGGSGTSTGTTNAAYQPFDNGFMIWRGDTRQIYVFYSATNTYQIFAPESYESLPENPVTDSVPINRIAPVQGFGRVWGNNTDVRTALGWGLAAEAPFTLTYTVTPNVFAFRFNLPDGRVVTGGLNGLWQFG